MRFKQLNYLGSVFLLMCCSALAEGLELEEYTLKATFLNNFLNFITWPKQPEPFNVCVVGENPFADHLDLLARENNKLPGRPPVFIKYSESVQGLEDCHIIYISASEERRQRAIIDYLQAYSVLTVSSLPGFARRGGHIEFITVHNRVRFYINYTAIKERGLKADANLLRVATETF